MKHRTRTFKKYAHWFFLALMILLTVYMDVYIAQNILDGDTSQKLVKGWHQAQTKNLFANDIYITTEVGLFDASAFATLFFMLFDDFTLVRLLTTLSMQAWYVLTFLYLCRQAEIRRSAACYGAGLLLLPFSTPYARIVLYHLYYLPFLANAFWIMGLTLRLVRSHQKPACSAVLLAGLWVFAGLNGIRYMMIIGLPMLVFAVIQQLLDLRRFRWENGRAIGPEPLFQTAAFRLLAVMIASCVFFVIGFVLNLTVLVPYFGAQNMSSTNFLPNAGADRYSELWNGWLIASGIRYTTQPLVGLRGVSMICSLFGFGYLLAASAASVFSADTMQRKFMLGMLGASFVTTTFIFLFESGDRSYELYYVPVVCLAIPALAQEINLLREKAVSLCRKLLILLACGCFLFQGVYTLYFIRADKLHMDQWSGLIYKVMDTTDRVGDCVAFMQENGYTMGLIDYWYANTMIEMSDGELNVFGLAAGFESRGQLEIHRWGASKDALDPAGMPEKAVVFIDRSWAERFESIFPDLPLVHEGWIFNGYEADTSLIQ